MLKPAARAPSAGSSNWVDVLLDAPRELAQGSQQGKVAELALIQRLVAASRCRARLQPIAFFFGKPKRDWRSMVR